jgi:membrane protein implicated in regulation of membrane protease activity
MAGLDLPTPLLWIIAGLVMMLLEMAVPGVFLIWLGLAALGTGLVLQVVDAGFAPQVVIFAAFAAVTVTIGLRFRAPRRSSQLNTPDSGLVGREAVVLEFHGRIGRVRVGDSDWSARLASGAAVPEPQASLRVVGVDGTTLVVGPP